MASYDAEINLIVSGFRQIRELEDRLTGIQNTIEEINDLGANAVMGRVTDMNSYSRVLKYLESSKTAMAGQVAEQQKVNATTRQQLLLYSQLNQEQSRFRRRSSAFTEESRGVRETNSRVIELTTQLRSAQRAFSQLFAEADIQGVRTINSEISSLLEELREINRVATGVKNVGANTGQLQAQADRWQMEIRALRQRASLLSENEEILARLLTAERNLIELRNADMTLREDANVRLGRQELENAAFLIKTEEDLANRRRRDASDYERQLQKQTQAIQQQAKQFGSLLKEAGKASSAIFNAVTFNRGPQIAKGAKNAAIRGGVGLGALGLGSAYMATQQALGNIDLGALSGPVGAAAKTVGSAINSALGGVPAIIGEMLSALGHIPSSLGLASVAALAFAPAMKTAADAVFLAGKKFGETKFGENIKLTLDRQTNIFESIINKASEMNIALDASKSGLDAIGTAVKTLPALPAAGQTAFRGEFRKGRSGAFIGGGARDILANPDYLIGATGVMAQRTKDAAETSLRFAEGLGQAAGEAKTVADYLAEAVKIQKITETPAKRFVRQTVELGRAKLENQRSAEIARERSAMLLGSSYSLSQVPARGELFPGGRTETAQPAYREMLNNAARVSQLQQEILDQMSKQQGFAATIGQLERRTINDKGRSLSIQEQENTELEKSIQIIRERNKELRQRPIAQMTPEERVSQGILDPGSLRAQRRRRVEVGRLDPLERFYAGFQPRRQAARSARATSEGLIGGAFPLLFGQGLGASVGGGLGGALGGFAGGGLGFGLSLIGTALGTAFDTAIQSAKELGDALKDSSKTFDLVKEHALFSSRETEKFAAKLQEAGYTASASALAQQEIVSKIGASGVQSLENLSDSSDRLNRAWAEFNLQLQAALAGPMAGLLEWLAIVISLANKPAREQAKAQDIYSGLSKQDKKIFSARVNKLLAMPTPEGQSPYDQYRNATAQVAKEMAAKAKSAALATSPEQQQKQLDETINAYQKRLEAIDIGKSLRDQVRQAAREQQDLDKQRADLVRSYEENIAQIRKRVEDEIARRRFSILEKENQLLDLQGQNRLKALQIANKQFIANAGTGQRPEVEQAAKRAAEIVAQFTESQVSAEEEAAKIKRDAALDARKFDYEAAQFKANIEQEVSRLNIETARRVAEINEQVRRRNEEYDGNRFEVEKKIADLQLKKEQTTAESAIAGLKLAIKQSKEANAPTKGLENTLAIYEEQLRAVVTGKGDIQKITAPAKLRGVGAVGGGGVSTTGLNQLVTKEGKTIEKLTAESLRGVDLSTKESLDNFSIQIQELIKDTKAPITSIGTAIQDEQAKGIRYTELLQTGIRGVVAERIIELEQMNKITQASYDAIIATLEIRKTIKGTTAEQIEAINQQINAVRNAKIDAEAAVPDLSKKIISTDRGSQIRDFVNQATSDLNDLESVAIRVSQSIGDAVGSVPGNFISSMSQSAQERDAIEMKIKKLQELQATVRQGSEAYADYERQIASAREEMSQIPSAADQVRNAIVDMLKNIAEALMQEAAKMIATYTAIGIAKMFAGINGGGAPAVDKVSNLNAAVASYGLANGGVFNGNGSGISTFANGGMFTNSIVKSPTLFKFADGAALRSGVMGEAGPEAVMPLTRASDGRLGVDASGLGSGTGVAVTVNVDAKGTQVQGNDQQGNQLGRAISAAVQQELIKQQRPGGLLAAR